MVLFAAAGLAAYHFLGLKVAVPIAVLLGLIVAAALPGKPDKPA